MNSPRQSAEAQPRFDAVHPRVKLWFEAGGESVLCRGMRDILRAVEETGSIKLAAEQLGRSYRFIWARVKETETALGATLVETHVGGTGPRRSELTPLARDLVQMFDDLSVRIRELVEETLTTRLESVLQQYRSES